MIELIGKGQTTTQVDLREDLMDAESQNAINDLLFSQQNNH
jgi:hypothetical protein